MKNTLNRGFSEYSNDALVTKVGLIIGQLTGNAYFAVTDPTMAQLATARDGLTGAMAQPDTPARRTAVASHRDIVGQMLEDLADNLEKTAANDVAKLATTGFDLKKDRVVSTEAPAVPLNLRLKTTGTSGEVQVLFDPSDRARSYQVQYTFDPNVGPWTDYDTFSSSRGIVVKGQPRAKDIWVRVRALGPNNTRSGWSDPATMLVN
jgi:hypothetical protein